MVMNTFKYIMTEFYPLDFTKRTLVVLYEIFIYRIYIALYFTINKHRAVYMACCALCKLNVFACVWPIKLK